MTVWVTSDLWFGSVDAAKSRGFDNAVDMGKEIVERHNTCVADEDMVFYLGSMGEQLDAVADHMPRMNGTKVLIASPYDNCWMQDVHDLYDVLFDHVRTTGIMDGPDIAQITGVPEYTKLKMSHFPYSDNVKDACTEWDAYRPIDDGNLLLCGHMLDKWSFAKSEESGAVMINVGVDVWKLCPLPIPSVHDPV